MSIQAQLDQLETAGLIRLAQTQPDLEYLFRHNLVQDAAYESLLRQDRRRLHRAVGEALEQAYPGRIDELAPLLGEHFAQAGDGPQALRYFTRAGEHEAGRYANAEAEMHYGRAIQFALELQAGADVLLDLYTRRGRVLELSGRHDEALANYEKLGELGDARGNRALELAALQLRATVYATPTARFDSLRGEMLAGQALTLARELGDRVAEARALWNLMLVKIFSGHYAESLTYGDQSLAIARELGLREQMAYTLNDLYNAYVALSEFDRAGAVLEESRGLWQELGNLPMLANNLNSAAERCYLIGQLDRAVELAGEALQTSVAIGNLWGQSYSLLTQSFVYIERGEFGRAIRTMEECMRLGDESGFAFAQIATRSLLALIYGQLGMPDRGIEITHAALSSGARNLPAMTSWMLAAQAVLYALKGNPDAAEEVYRTARARLEAEHLSATTGAFMVPMADIQIALARRDYERAQAGLDGFIELIRKAGVYIFLADALCVRGNLFLAQRRVEEARAVLLDALAVTESRGAKRTLWLVLVALAEVESRSGNAGEARRLRERARGILDWIVAQIDDPDLRRVFLGLNDVRSLLAQTDREMRVA
jgi:tetratricopeptide (TPR) repeat protein